MAVKGSRHLMIAITFIENVYIKQSRTPGTEFEIPLYSSDSTIRQTTNPNWLYCTFL